MAKCLDKECRAEFEPSKRRKTTKQKLSQVYCDKTIEENFEFDGFPKLLYRYGGIKGLWIDLVNFSTDYAEDNNLEIFSDAYEYFPPIFEWSCRKVRKNKKSSEVVFGLNYLNGDITIYITRFKSMLHIVEVVVHEMIHSIMFFVFNDDISVNGGHTKVFWDFFFKFCNYIGLEYEVSI